MSKDLKALHELTKVIKGVDTSLYQYNEYISDIKNSLKALEIIWFKKVDIIKLGNCFEMKNGYEFYNQGFIEIYKLTQEEYDLLKKALL